MQRRDRAGRSRIAVPNAGFAGLHGWVQCMRSPPTLAAFVTESRPLHGRWARFVWAFMAAGSRRARESGVCRAREREDRGAPNWDAVGFGSRRCDCRAARPCGYRPVRPGGSGALAMQARRERDVRCGPCGLARSLRALAPQRAGSSAHNRASRAEAHWPLSWAWACSLVNFESIARHNRATAQPRSGAAACAPRPPSARRPRGLPNVQEPK